MDYIQLLDYCSDICGKNRFEFSAKLAVKQFMFHNVQRRNRAAIALKWDATDSYIQFGMPKMLKIMHNNLLCEKGRKSRYFCGRIFDRIVCSRKVNKGLHV